MAHAGTTSTSSGQIGLWKALLAAVVIAAIGIGMVLAVPFITGRAVSAPAVDNSYNQIETLRGVTTLPGAAVDADAVAKAAAAKARAMSGVAPENSLDAAVRGQSGVTLDTTYNAAEKARSGAFSGTTIDPSTFDRTPRGAHGQLP